MRDYLRPDEVDAMVQAARKSGRHRVRDAAIIMMMYRHGLRTAELVALRWQQVDLKAGYLDRVVFQKWRWPCLHCPSKGIAIDKQANDDVVHLYRF
jgi:integrase